VSDPSSLRVADADREQLVDDLREHMLAGRLSSGEFEERLEKAYRASTRGEVDALKADLPMSPATLNRALVKRKADLRRRLLQETGGALGVSIICVSIWAAAGAQSNFWPAWVIAVTLLPLVRNAWRVFGPAPDLESVEAHLRGRHERRLERQHRRSRHRRLPR